MSCSGLLAIISQTTSEVVEINSFFAKLSLEYLLENPKVGLMFSYINLFLMAAAFAAGYYFLRQASVAWVGAIVVLVCGFNVYYFSKAVKEG